jgi:hypothetical protein
LAYILAAPARAQSASDVVLFVRSLASTLAQAHDADGLGRADAGPFLDHFDPKMPGFSTLRDEIESLVTRAEVGSSVEILSDEGDSSKRTLKLDWILEIQDQRPRRQLITCTIERQKKDWKITAIEPLTFFQY